MSRFKGHGKRLREARERLGLSRLDFARRIGCTEEQLRFIEDAKGSEPLGILSIIERAAEEFDLSPEALLIAEPGLWDLRICQLIRAAVRIIRDRKLCTDWPVISWVLERIEHEFDQAATALPAEASFRQIEAVFAVDEDRIRDLITRAKRELGGHGLWH